MNARRDKNNLKPKDWDIIESALWFAKQKSRTFGEQEKFNKVYLKVVEENKYCECGGIKMEESEFCKGCI